MKKFLFASLLSVIALPSLAQSTDEVDTVFTATSNPFVKYKHLGDPAALVKRQLHILLKWKWMIT